MLIVGDNRRIRTPPRLFVVSIALLSLALTIGPLAEWIRYRFDRPDRWVPDLLAGWALIGAGAVAARGRPQSRVGVLLIATGFAWFVGNLGGSSWAWLAWIGAQGVYLHRGPLVQCLVTFPSGRITGRVERCAVVVAYVAALIEPMWRTEWIAITLSVLLVAVAFWRHAMAPARERRARRSALWLTAGVAGVIAGTAIARLVAGSDVVRNVELPLYEVTLCVVAVGLTVVLLARPYDEVTNLVVELGEQRAGSVRDSLAHALGDPALELGFWSPTVQHFVDASGRTLALPTEHDGRASTVIEGGEEPIAVIVHDRSLLDEPALIESVGTAARLASANARLQADVRAQVAALDASRRRIVTAGDAGSRQLEARLRAGPERRLEELILQISSERATSEDEEADRMLASLENQLAGAVDELQRLAGGLHPRLLSKAGLSGALHDLASRCPVPVHATVDVGTTPSAIETAVYYVCSEALANATKHAGATRVDVTVTASASRVTVTVGDDGHGGAAASTGHGLRNLTDRVEALGGRLVVISPAGAGTRLVAELPLGDQS